MTTLSQSGSLFRPSSAYLPQELLGKVRHSPLLYSSPPRGGTGSGTAQSGNRSLFPGGRRCFTPWSCCALRRPEPGAAHPRLRPPGGLRRPGPLRPHPGPQLQPEGVRELLPLLPRPQVAAARERSGRARGARGAAGPPGPCSAGSPRPQRTFCLAARTEDGKEELRFLSGSNPRQLERLAAPL